MSTAYTVIGPSAEPTANRWNSGTVSPSAVYRRPGAPCTSGRSGHRAAMAANAGNMSNRVNDHAASGSSWRAMSPKASSVTSTDGRSLTLSGEAQAAGSFRQLWSPCFQRSCSPLGELVVRPIGLQLVRRRSISVRAGAQRDP